MIFFKNYFISTTNGIDVLPIVHEVQRTVRESEITDGLACISVPETGAALFVLEPLPDVISGLQEALRILPGEEGKSKDRFKREIELWPRVAGAIFQRALCMPLKEGRLALGQREEPMLVDFERRSARREFFVQVMGDAPQANQPPLGRAPQGQRR